LSQVKTLSNRQNRIRIRIYPRWLAADNLARTLSRTLGAPLNHTFSAPLIKIARARKHLTELKEEIGVFY